MQLAWCSAQPYTRRHLPVTSLRLRQSWQSLSGHSLSAKPQQKLCLQRHSNVARVVQVSSAAQQQQLTGQLSASGLGGSFPSESTWAFKFGMPTGLRCVRCCPGFMNWVNTSKPPKFLWRTLAALVMGGQALVRILQGVACLSTHCTQCSPLWHTCIQSKLATLS